MKYIIGTGELVIKEFDNHDVLVKNKYGGYTYYKDKIRIGDHVKTNSMYKFRLYEPLYHEEIFDAIVLDIDKSNVVTLELVETSCNFYRKFDYHMNKWKCGCVTKIGMGWLEKK